MTYIWTGSQWRYLAAVLDLYNRKVVGFALLDSPDSELTKQALSHVFESRGRPSDAMFHSDQGCHYTSLSFRQLLWTYRIKQSMSRQGHCLDNAVVESFFHSLKTERVKRKIYEDRNTARADLFNYIEMFYNRKRLHSHLGHVSPDEYEKRHLIEN